MADGDTIITRITSPRESGISAVTLARFITALSRLKTELAKVDGGPRRECVVVGISMIGNQVEIETTMAEPTKKRKPKTDQPKEEA